MKRNGKYYPQLFWRECTYKLKECRSTKKLMLEKELTLIEQMHQKNVCFVINGTLKMLDLNFKHTLHVCNKCHDVLMTAYELKNITILNVKGVDFRCILWGISRDEAVIG